MIPFDEALGRISALARPLGSEALPLSLAAGRVLAKPVIAQIDSPQADCSVMDGYAVREADLPGPLTVVGEAFPGRSSSTPLRAGTCARVFTGAPIPEGADRVVIQEEVERLGNEARFPIETDEPPHIRAEGSDFRAGDLLVEAGTRVTPGVLVTAAAADLAEVDVWRRVRVAILATGNELVPPGEARSRPGAVPDSITGGLAALVAERGAEVVAISRLRDDLDAMRAAAADAIAVADLVVVTGGASVGDRDFAKPMFEPLGLELAFSKVAMKPGKPAWLGRCRDSLVMGLPGNPTSAMVTGRLLLVPLIAGLAGGNGALRWTRIELAGELPAVGDRETFVRARRRADGAMPLGNQQSGAQAPLAHADLLLRCPAHGPAHRRGEIVDAIEFWRG